MHISVFSEDSLLSSCTNLRQPLWRTLRASRELGKLLCVPVNENFLLRFKTTLQVCYVIMENRGALYKWLEAPMVKTVNHVVFVTDIERPSMAGIDCRQMGGLNFARADLVLWQHRGFPARPYNTQWPMGRCEESLPMVCRVAYKNPLRFPPTRCELPRGSGERQPL